MEEVLTVAEVAEELKSNIHYVYKLRDKGFLKMMKLGTWKCRRAALDAFIVWAEGKDLTDLDNVKELQFPTAI